MVTKINRYASITDYRKNKANSGKVALFNKAASILMLEGNGSED